jgi:PilZ domain
MSMEQRREPRFAANQPITVTVLGGKTRTVPATVKDASSRGLAIEVGVPIEPYTSLEVEFEDSFVMGEAVYCRQQPGSWLIGVELDQVLCSLSSLGRKLQELANPKSVRNEDVQRPEKLRVPIP